MAAVLVGPASVVRCERLRCWRVLLGKAKARREFARMCLARAEWVAGVYGAGEIPAIGRWTAELARRERVAKYVARRYRLAVALGV